MLEFFAKFQTFFVGILGFAGVVIAMLYNGKKQEALQSRQQQHNVQSVRSALRAELKMNAEMYESRINSLSESKGNQHALIPSKVVNTVYQTLLPNIGLLSVEEAELVVRAYVSLEELPYRLRILVGTDSVGGINNEFIRIDEGRQRAAGQIHKALLPSVHNALAALSENAPLMES